MTPNAYGERHAEVWLVAVAARDLEFEFVTSRRHGLGRPKCPMRPVPPRTIFGDRVDALVASDPMSWKTERVGPGAWLLGWLDEEGWDAFLEDWGWEGREAFLLEHGIAPGQPFKVRVRCPGVTRDFWGEYDVDVELAEVLEVAPWDVDRAACAWSRHLRVEARYPAFALLFQGFDSARCIYY